MTLHFHYTTNIRPPPPDRGPACCDNPARRQEGGDANPGKKRLYAAPQSTAQKAAQLCSERTLNAALNHMDAPQQQRHGGRASGSADSGAMLLRAGS